jgi:hypothetical protein
MEITERMCAAALEAYWGPRPYVPYKRRQKWTDKEMEGMHDAIKAALVRVSHSARQRAS